MKNKRIENNLCAWEKKFPGSRIEIEEKYKEWKIYRTENTDIVVDTELASDGNVILKVTKDHKTRYLGGRRNSIEPVDVWYQTIGRVEESAMFFFGGIGNPLYVKKIIENQTTKNVSIIIYEPSREIFFTVLENIDIVDILESRADCIFIVDGISGIEINEVIKKMISVVMMEHVRTIILPNYDRVFSEKIMEFAKNIRRQCDVCAAAINTQVRFSNVYAMNMFSNAPFLLDAYKTKQLTEVIPRDIPAIVVAAGPSLNNNIEELKRAKGKAFIIAVDTAIKPLLKRGIVPDMFAIVDGKKPIELVQDDEAKKIPLLTSISAAHGVLAYHTGMKFFYNEGDTYINSMFFMNGKVLEPLACGGSVATAAFALAFMIGIDTVILVGQDLALTGNKTHADGTFEEKMKEVDTSHSMMVPGNVEDKVPTRMDFKLYLDWYNEYIKECKDYRENFRVINATEGGARIENTEIMTLKEAIDRECTKEINIQERLSRLQPVLSGEERQRALNFLQKTPEHYRQMKEDALSINRLYNRLNKICSNSKINLKSYENVLKKIKKITKKIETDSIYYEPIKESLALANYVVQSESYDVKDTLKEEGKEIARQGIIYTDMVRQCAELFEEYTKETVGKAE